MEKPPFGVHKLPRWAELLSMLCWKMPDNWFGRRIVFLLRKPVLWIVDGPVDCTVEGASFRLSPSGNLSDKRLLCTPKMLDGAERSFLAGVIPKGGWVIDAGANIGGYSLLLAAVRPDLQILAIEADGNLADRMRSNVDYSSMSSHITVVNCAVTEVDGPVLLCRDSVNLGKNKIETSVSTGKNKDLEVQGYSLLSLLNQYGIERPDAIKLDIEGHEFAVMNGFFSAAPQVRWPEYIQLEQYRKAEDSPAARLVMQYGYSACLKSRMNVIYRRHVK